MSTKNTKAKEVSVNYILNKGSVILSIDGEVKIYAAGSDEYEKAKALIVKNDEAGLAKLANTMKEIVKKYEGFRVENDVVFIDNKPLPVYLGKRLRQFADEGADYTFLLKFWDNLRCNPSQESIDNLFDFLERTHCQIDKNGHALLYKTVRSDYYDKWSGKILNTPGTYIRAPREEIDSDRRKQCSYGLHCGGLSYTHWYGKKDDGDRLLLVSVDPADVIAVPTDHNFTKMRVCKYFVEREVSWSVEQPTKQTYEG